MPIVNLTQHTIHIADEAGVIVMKLPPSGTVARVSNVAEPADPVEGVPVVISSYGTPSGLPEPKPGVVYLVSSMVAMAAKRADVVSPDTGPTAIREDGHVIAVRRFQRFV